MRIPSFGVPLSDPETGMITREWYRFLFELSRPDLPFTTASGSSAPSTGTWGRGDIVWNIEPSAGGIPGWVCVSGGNPGTWKAMANLAA